MAARSKSFPLMDSVDTQTSSLTCALCYNFYFVTVKRDVPQKEILKKVYLKLTGKENNF